MSGQERVTEFTGIFMNDGQHRRVMSKPPTAKAAQPLIDQVRFELDIEDLDDATRIADWVAGKLQRFEAFEARPVFDMDGSGPQCSTCGMIWPLCGHHHFSYAEGINDDEEKDA